MTFAQIYRPYPGYIRPQIYPGYGQWGQYGNGYGQWGQGGMKQGQWGGYYP